jgi:hypothetical protein
MGPRYSLLIAGAAAENAARVFAFSKAESAEQAALAACSAVYAASQHTGANTADCAYRAESLGVDVIEICYAQRWPLTVPTIEQLAAARPEDQVAWDAVADTPGDITVEQLIVAYGACLGPRLNWAEPIHRALAERRSLL